MSTTPQEIPGPCRIGGPERMAVELAQTKCNFRLGCIPTHEQNTWGHWQNAILPPVVWAPAPAGTPNSNSVSGLSGVVTHRC